MDVSALAVEGDLRDLRSGQHTVGVDERQDASVTVGQMRGQSQQVASIDAGGSPLGKNLYNPFWVGRFSDPSPAGVAHALSWDSRCACPSGSEESTHAPTDPLEDQPG